MSKYLGILCSLLVICAVSVLAEESGQAGSELWFDVGEEIEYQIYWGVIPVGFSVASTKWIEEDGKKLVLIRFRTKTNKWMDRIYPVDDIIESTVDPETFLPVRFVKKQSEGRYRSDEHTVFDHKKGKAQWESFVKGRKKEYDIEKDTRDIVSFMYYTRSQEFREGEQKTFRVMADEKIYDLHVKVIERERVKTTDGKKIKSVKLEPKATFDGLFVRKGKMRLWVSEEKPSVVTKLAAKVPVASVKLVLADVRKSVDDDDRLQVLEGEEKVEVVGGADSTADESTVEKDGHP